MPILREHADSYSYYFRYKPSDINPKQTSFQITFNQFPNKNSGVLYRTIYPQIITLSIQDVFITYIHRLIEHIEHIETDRIF